MLWGGITIVGKGYLPDNQPPSRVNECLVSWYYWSKAFIITTKLRKIMRIRGCVSKNNAKY